MDKKEEVYQILELGTHLKNLHHKKGFGGFLFIDLPMTKFSKLSTYIRQLDKENQKYKEVIDKANNKLNSFIECCKAEKLESGSDYLHHSYWDMFERFNKQIKDILKEVK